VSSQFVPIFIIGTDMTAHKFFISYSCILPSSYKN